MIKDLFVREELVLLPQLSHHAGGLHTAVLVEVARLRLGLPRGAIIAMMQDSVAADGVMIEGLRQLDSDLAPELPQAPAAALLRHGHQFVVPASEQAREHGPGAHTTLSAEVRAETTGSISQSVSPGT